MENQDEEGMRGNNRSREESQTNDSHISGQQQQQHSQRTSRKWFSKIGGDRRSKEDNIRSNHVKATSSMVARWGPPNSPKYEMAMRYWRSTRMESHWWYLATEHPKRFQKYLKQGYMEPIPTAWIETQELEYGFPSFTHNINAWRTPAEKRLYYMLNNGVMPDGLHHASIRPLRIYWDAAAIIKRKNERIARQAPLDPARLAAYRSTGDAFHCDSQITSQEYSYQVPNVVSEAGRRALHEPTVGISGGTDHLETMLLIDVSGSMTWNPRDGVVGPDSMRRVHDQPPNIDLTRHLVYRVLHHMVIRAQREYPRQMGIPTVKFSTHGRYVGQMSAQNFKRDWDNKIRIGGGTRVMQGWQVVKKTYFEIIQSTQEQHGRFDPEFGWQATPGMPKLSLLVFLDGEADDMNEFEMELMGESWAYVTICLAGMENCPHHHSHAIHVAFLDCYGRVCERMVVEDLLGRMYPADPRSYEEILKPEYDLSPDDLPPYVP